MVYIHVPFCREFCAYCSFHSMIPTGERCMDAYADRLCREIQERAAQFGRNPNTLYFGGGTPSTLPATVLSRILITLTECGYGAPYTEFTMEVNPEDIAQRGVSYIKNLLDLGVNRVSMGVQSFDDAMLRRMHRRHTADTARRAFGLLRDAGVENVSLDLMFGMDGLDREAWEETVDTAVALGPEHISCYQLSTDAPCKRPPCPGERPFAEADEEDCRAQYTLLCDKLRAAGYGHYEISNFAKPGREAVHNMGYWQRKPFVGLGPTAHSFQGNTRSWNTCKEGDALDYAPEQECLSDDEARMEMLMLMFRTAQGMDADTLHRLCRKEDVQRLLHTGALCREGLRYRIPEDHFFVSDEIVRELV